MKNFTYFNPVRIVFGTDALDQLQSLIPKTDKVMLVTGGGSIRRNGVYDRVRDALVDHAVVEYEGIQPNPEYDQCVEAAARARDEGVAFLLSVGGGSVLDATKFIAVAALFNDGDPWDVPEKGVVVERALPIGCVLTLPATGSEMNGNSVISRRSRTQKMAFSSPKVMPLFSLLDPTTTHSLPWRQTANGIVDTFVHVMEQYLTVDVHTPLQDRQAEAILSTLIETAAALQKNPQDADARSTLMWAATNALNGLIGCGTVQDWSSHIIGHEITALHGLDHAQTLAIILPAIMFHQRHHKGAKIVQYGQRVLGITGDTDEDIIVRAIEKTAAFFDHVGNPTRLSAYGITVDQCVPAARAIAARGMKIGEHGDIGEHEIVAILNHCQ